MGEPILDPPRMPTTLPGNPAFAGSPAANVDLDLGDCRLQVTCVSMGNPHCVTFVEAADRPLGARGRAARGDRSAFPQAGQRRVRPGPLARRGADAGVGARLRRNPGLRHRRLCRVRGRRLTGRTARRILAHLPGGDLELEWAADNHVYMTGEAVEVFSGEWNDGDR